MNYQLFKVTPPFEFVRDIVKLYGINDLDENFEFTRCDLEKRDLLNQLKNMKNELSKYYLDCKSDKYLENLTIKKSITLLRHLIKIYNYKVVAREKYNNKKKFLLYHLEKINKTNDGNLTLNFD